MRKHFIGEPVLFSINEKEMTIGEIIEIIHDKNMKFKIREATCEPTEDGFNYYMVNQEDILEVKAKQYKPTPNEWVIRHLDEINKAFEKDMSEYVLLVYNTFNDVVKDFGDYAHMTEFCRPVKDKWIFIAA